MFGVQGKGRRRGLGFPPQGLRVVVGVFGVGIGWVTVWVWVEGMRSGLGFGFEYN